MSEIETTILRMVFAGFMAAIVVTIVAFIPTSGVGVGATTTTIIYHNATIERNFTVYQNTTNNITSPHWDNTTTYVNTTQYANSTIYHNSTVYVNTTVIQFIPVVNVTYLLIDFTSPSLGTNYSIPLPVNYSLPVGTVTWMVVTLNETKCGGGYSITVNSPWVILSDSDWSTPQVISVNVLLGVPYYPGTFPIIVTVS
jgi:hypothetical protein